MSRVITPPDTDFASKNPTVLLVNAPDVDVEVVTLHLKQLPQSIDLYLYRDEFEDTGWAFNVAAVSDRVFTYPNTNVEEIITWLNELNG